MKLIVSYYEWRPISLCSRPHARYQLFVIVFLTFTLFMTHFLHHEYLLILEMMDTSIILMLITLHIFYMGYYRAIVNQVQKFKFINLIR